MILLLSNNQIETFKLHPSIIVIVAHNASDSSYYSVSARVTIRLHLCRSINSYQPADTHDSLLLMLICATFILLFMVKGKLMLPALVLLFFEFR